DDRRHRPGLRVVYHADVRDLSRRVTEDARLVRQGSRSGDPRSAGSAGGSGSAVVALASKKQKWQD
ncbi:MAG: hypothetical protein WBB46_08020, partial [Candidatus Deferrimicrobiaceae bacterium]